MPYTSCHFNHTQKTVVIDVQNEAHLQFTSDVFQWARFRNGNLMQLMDPKHDYTTKGPYQAVKGETTRNKLKDPQIILKLCVDLSTCFWL